MVVTLINNLRNCVSIVSFLKCCSIILNLLKIFVSFTYDFPCKFTSLPWLCALMYVAYQVPVSSQIKTICVPDKIYFDLLYLHLSI